MFLFLILQLLFFPHVVADCPSGSILYSPLSTCYFFMTTPQKFSDAESTCKNLGGNLASIHDSFANNFIYTEAGTIFSTNANFTIGISCNYGNCSWTDGSSYTYNDFAISSNFSGCGTMGILNGGYWNIQNCFDEEPFVCERAETYIPTSPKPASLCPSDEWYYFEETNSCYFWTNTFDWATAEAFCIRQDSHLTSIHSSNEMKFLNYIYNGYIWIGLHTDDNPVILNTTFKWTDGTYLDYHPWSGTLVSMPYLGYNAQCVSTDDKKIWNGDCSSNRTGICKKPSSKIVSSTTNSPPTQNCSNGWTYYFGTKSCYLGPTPILSQNEAEDYCKSKGGHLASIHSDDEYKFLLYATSTNVSWVGLYSTENPVQINTTWQWTDGTIVDYITWFDGIPSLDDKNCAVYTYKDGGNRKSTYAYQNVVCSTVSYSGICKQPSLNSPPTSSPAPTSQLPNPCDSVYTFGNFENYFIPLAQMNWTTAEEYCELCGGYLTSFHSSDELRTIATNAFNNHDELNKNFTYFWIGHTYNGRTWKWVDGTPFNYSYWMSGYPYLDGSAYANLEIDGYLSIRNYGMNNGQNSSSSFYGICKSR